MLVLSRYSTVSKSDSHSRDGLAYFSHHIHRILSKFIYQTVSQFKPDPVLTGDRAFKLHGSSLNVGNYIPSCFFLALFADDRGVEIAYQGLQLYRISSVKKQSGFVGPTVANMSHIRTEESGIRDNLVSFFYHAC